MKKIASSSVLIMMILFITLIFQSSCQKEKISSANNSGNGVGKILYLKLIQGNYEVWISEINGENNHKLNLTYPDGFQLNGSVSPVPDGSKLFFSLYNSSTDETNIYSSNIDGTNLRKIDIALPTDITIIGSVIVSKDGSKLIFTTYNSGAETMIVYSANIDGSNPTQLITGGDIGGIQAF